MDVMRHGPHVEVIEPAALRDEVRTAARNGGPPVLLRLSARAYVHRLTAGVDIPFTYRAKMRVLRRASRATLLHVLSLSDDLR